MKGKFFRKRKVKREQVQRKSRMYMGIYEPEKIYLLTTDIISSYNDGSGAGPRNSVVQYFLATKEDEKYYELFSKVELTTEEEFDVPCIKKVECMKEYVKDPTVVLSAEELFYFITSKNTRERLKEEN